MFSTLVDERLFECWNKGVVSSRQATCTNYMHIIIDRLSCDLLRSLEQATNIDVEAQVSEPARDYFSAAIVTILAHLGDKDARVATLFLSKLLNSF